MEGYENNVIVMKTLQFSLGIMAFTDVLGANRRFVFANQLLKSGTSIGANVREAQSAESKADFVHKMKIASKEAEETEYWLTLCLLAPNYPNPEELLPGVREILKILGKIISSSK
ncbi:MAG: four helix bundle protein [Cytophagaceae bacterium]|nr:four helix bundle protein [Cytophagaceae bacterium]